tara:strand:+ start:1172 stop:1384 length:213 start_codon:yes stop_codon:yes gene_type:complete
MDLGINPGYIAVFFGLVLFYLGYVKGKEVGREQGAGGMIDMLHKNGYLKVKTRSVDEKGNPVTEFAKIDE